MSKCKIILDSNEFAVITQNRKEQIAQGNFLYEKDYEEELIRILQSQGYQYIEKINSEGLKDNLRKQIERLNSKRIPDFRFTDREWKWFYKEYFEGINNTGIENRTKKIQGNECRKLLIRDDGTTLNIAFLDKENIEENYLQVINQFVDQDSSNRYDVTILVNGLPLVHIELKNAGQSLKESFQQIERYKRDSFHELFEFIQIFVISNGAETKYYSNTTSHKEDNSFLFTTHWANFKNGTITHLFDFARTFLARKSILSMITKYCVFDIKKELKILRPYQISAIEEILDQINLSINEKTSGINAGGFVWHTTGSGKTLTSFKAAQLATKIPQVKKVLFVVDRKDLDSQTHHEYKKFLGENLEQTIDNTKNTEVLKRLLNDDEKRIIITTIQKLRRLLTNKNQLRNSLAEERVVIIMDECHRSQTEETHKEYLNFFKKKNVFGFTGTPIWKGENTTKQRFGKELHRYTIIDAIHNNNVLKFWIDYVIDKEQWSNKIKISSPKRIEAIVSYVLDHFEIKTNPNTDGDAQLVGKTKFNSMFAASNINEAIKYYREFKKQIKEKGKNIKVATIFSACQDKEIVDPRILEKDEAGDEDGLEENQIEALREARKDFEHQFNCRISGDLDYRNEISEKTKNREIDILIVVNMFLTGFDAPTLNTLWVDKNLRDHNLIQAFSRTNRTYNKTKTHGNIICFRDIKEEVDIAIKTYAAKTKDSDDPRGLGDENEVAGIIFVKPSKERIEEYQVIENQLLREFPDNKEIVGETEERRFIELYGKFLELSNELSCCDEFEQYRKINPAQRKEYKSKYLGIWEKWKKQRNKTVQTQTDMSLDFKLELIRSDEINIDYILNVVGKYMPGCDREEILSLIRACFPLRREEPIVVEFFDRRDRGEEIDYLEHKKQKYTSFKDKEIIENFNLRAPEVVHEFMDKSIKDKKLSFEGSGIDTKILPPIPIRTGYEKRNELWSSVKDKIRDCFDLFKNIKL